MRTRDCEGATAIVPTVSALQLVPTIAVGSGDQLEPASDVRQIRVDPVYIVVGWLGSGTSSVRKGIRSSASYGGVMASGSASCPAESKRR